MKGAKRVGYKLKAFLQQVALIKPELRDLILKVGRHCKSFTIF